MRQREEEEVGQDYMHKQKGGDGSEKNQTERSDEV
jgi:hypothetical protein